jgi:hypothetical protein
MPALIQKLYPALHPGQRLALAGTRQPLLSQQGDWDAGSALHCVAMALAMLGKLSDPVDVRGYASGPVARFWDRAWPHYRHGLTHSGLAGFVWELDAGVQPVQVNGSPAELARFCAEELVAGWPVIVWVVNRRTDERHAALVVGIEERDAIPKALLLLDPAGAAPVLAACNARLEFGESHASYITAGVSVRAAVDGAVSIRPAGGQRYRSRLRLISGGVAALARRSPVGASDTASSGPNRPASVMFSAWQMFASVSIEGLAMPRSMAEMYVRSTCASKASVSCDLSTSCRRCLMRRPSATMIGAGERVADSGRRAVMPGRMPV